MLALDDARSSALGRARRSLSSGESSSLSSGGLCCRDSSLAQARRGGREALASSAKQACPNEPPVATAWFSTHQFATSVNRRRRSWLYRGLLGFIARVAQPLLNLGVVVESLASHHVPGCGELFSSGSCPPTLSRVR